MVKGSTATLGRDGKFERRPSVGKRLRMSCRNLVRGRGNAAKKQAAEKEASNEPSEIIVDNKVEVGEDVVKNEVVVDDSVKGSGELDVGAVVRQLVMDAQLKKSRDKLNEIDMPEDTTEKTVEVTVEINDECNDSTSLKNEVPTNKISGKDVVSIVSSDEIVVEMKEAPETSEEKEVSAESSNENENNLNCATPVISSNLEIEEDSKNSNEKMETDEQTNTEDNVPVTHIVEVHDEDLSYELTPTEKIMQVKEIEIHVLDKEAPSSSTISTNQIALENTFSKSSPEDNLSLHEDVPSLVSTCEILLKVQEIPTVKKDCETGMETTNKDSTIVDKIEESDEKLTFSTECPVNDFENFESEHSLEVEHLPENGENVVLQIEESPQELLSSLKLEVNSEPPNSLSHEDTSLYQNHSLDGENQVIVEISHETNKLPIESCSDDINVLVQEKLLCDDPTLDENPSLLPELLQLQETPNGEIKHFDEITLMDGELPRTDRNAQFQEVQSQEIPSNEEVLQHPDISVIEQISEIQLKSSNEEIFPMPIVSSGIEISQSLDTSQSEETLHLQTDAPLEDDVQVSSFSQHGNITDAEDEEISQYEGIFHQDITSVQDEETSHFEEIFPNMSQQNPDFNTISPSGEIANTQELLEEVSFFDNITQKANLPIVEVTNMELVHPIEKHSNVLCISPMEDFLQVNEETENSDDLIFCEEITANPNNSQMKTFEKDVSLSKDLIQEECVNLAEESSPIQSMSPAEINTPIQSMSFQEDFVNEAEETTYINNLSLYEEMTAIPNVPEIENFEKEVSLSGDLTPVVMVPLMEEISKMEYVNHIEESTSITTFNSMPKMEDFEEELSSSEILSHEETFGVEQQLINNVEVEPVFGVFDDVETNPEKDIFSHLTTSDTTQVLKSLDMDFKDVAASDPVHELIQNDALVPNNDMTSKEEYALTVSTVSKLINIEDISNEENTFDLREESIQLIINEDFSEDTSGRLSITSENNDDNEVLGTMAPFQAFCTSEDVFSSLLCKDIIEEMIKDSLSAAPTPTPSEESIILDELEMGHETSDTVNIPSNSFLSPESNEVEISGDIKTIEEYAAIESEGIIHHILDYLLNNLFKEAADSSLIEEEVLPALDFHDEETPSISVVDSIDEERSITQNELLNVSFSFQEEPCLHSCVEETTLLQTSYDETPILEPSYEKMSSTNSSNLEKLETIENCSRIASTLNPHFDETKLLDNCSEEVLEMSFEEDPEFNMIPNHFDMPILTFLKTSFDDVLDMDAEESYMFEARYDDLPILETVEETEEPPEEELNSFIRYEDAQCLTTLTDNQLENTPPNQLILELDDDEDQEYESIESLTQKDFSGKIGNTLKLVQEQCANAGNQTECSVMNNPANVLACLEESDEVIDEEMHDCDEVFDDESDEDRTDVSTDEGIVTDENYDENEIMKRHFNLKCDEDTIFFQHPTLGDFLP